MNICGDSIETKNEETEYNEQEFIKKNNVLFITNYDSFKQHRHLYTNEQIINNICYIDENNLIIQYAFFKKFGNKTNYDIITHHIVNNINNILIQYELINIHFSLYKMDLFYLD